MKSQEEVTSPSSTGSMESPTFRLMKESKQLPVMQESLAGMLDSHGCESSVAVVLLEIFATGCLIQFPYDVLYTGTPELEYHRQALEFFMERFASPNLYSSASFEVWPLRKDFEPSAKSGEFLIRLTMLDLDRQAGMYSKCWFTGFESWEQMEPVSSLLRSFLCELFRIPIFIADCEFHDQRPPTPLVRLQ